jgi:hypothetical protein
MSETPKKRRKKSVLESMGIYFKTVNVYIEKSGS